MTGAIGDLLRVRGHRVGEHPRLGEITEVLGEPDHVHFRVRWEDGQETIVFPGPDIVIQPATAAG
ncbi:MAG: DUF1918 domain-containing protein [Thermoleophilia bacterium]|nr:DUF1918 domain-containing protein [Thermoleophilia bacterium]